MQKQVTQVQGEFAEVARSFEALLPRMGTVTDSDIVSQTAALRASIAEVRTSVEELLSPVRERFVCFWKKDSAPVTVAKWVRKEPLAVPVLISVVQSETIEEEARELALRVLDKAGLPAEAVPCFVEALANDSDIASVAREALGKKRARTPLVVEALCRALQTPELVVAAVHTLSDLGSAAQSAVPAVLEAVRQYRVPGVGELLSRLGVADDDAVNVLESLAREGNAESRMDAINALHERGWTTNLPHHLISVLKQKDADTPSLAHAIALLDEVRVAPFLRPAAQKALLALRGHQALRCDIAQVLQQLSKAAVRKHLVPLLVHDLLDADPKVRKTTALTLGSMPVTPSAVAALKSLMEDPDLEVRSFAATALEEIEAS